MWRKSYQYFLDMPPQAKETTAKINKWNYQTEHIELIKQIEHIKLKNKTKQKLFLSEGNYPEKEKAAFWIGEGTFKHISDKRVLSKIYKYLIQLNINNNLIKKKKVSIGL